MCLGVFLIKLEDDKSQVFTYKLWFELFDALDEFRLLDATIAHLIPVGENLFQILHAQLLKVDSFKINRFLCKQ